MGNAAFHSNELYASLAASIQPLASSLGDADSKTRANVAGAIGNLIRNGGQLSRLMAEQQIPEKLMRMVVHDKDAQPQKTALFSLGTMAIFASTRASITSARHPTISEVLHSAERAVEDAEMQKYTERLRQKLRAAVQRD